MRQFAVSGVVLQVPEWLHGFGIGKGTVAEGWVDEAIPFWEAQNISSKKGIDLELTSNCTIKTETK